MSKRFEIDMGLNASDVAKGAKDAESALSDLEQAVGDVGSESRDAGGDISDFTRKLVTAARDAGKSDDEIRDALRKYGVNAKEAERAIEGIGDEFKETGRDGERALDDLEDSLRDVQRQSKKAGDSVDDIGEAGKDAGRSVKRGMHDASEGLDDFKSEAQQSAREAAASFDGSMESIAEVGQEIAANAFSGFGPAGVAAGIGVAAAAGVMVENFNKITEAADEARESAFAMAYDVAGALDAAGYATRLQEWTSETEKLNQVRDIAIGTGWDEVEVVDALAAGGDKLERLNAAWGEGADVLNLTNGRIWELEAVLKATGEGYLNGAQAADINARALYNFAQQAGTATGEVDDLGNKIIQLPDSTTVVVDASTQKAYENVDALEQKVVSVPDKNVRINVRADTSSAERSISRIINQGREIKIRTRIISPERLD